MGNEYEIYFFKFCFLILLRANFIPSSMNIIDLMKLIYGVLCINLNMGMGCLFSGTNLSIYLVWNFFIFLFFIFFKN